MWKKIKKAAKKAWEFIVAVEFVIVLLLIGIIYDIYGWDAAKWIAVIWIGYGVYRVWRGREVIMWAMRDVEEKIWGKSLDRVNWEKGELKKTKIRMRWNNEKNRKR